MIISMEQEVIIENELVYYNVTEDVATSPFVTTNTEKTELTKCGEVFISGHELFTFQCFLCDKIFTSVNNFMQHITESRKNYENCSDTVKTEDEGSVQEENLSDKERKKDVKSKTCKFCSQQCSSNSMRIAHERIHSGEKLFQCELCLKEFTKFSLARHKLTHKKNNLNLSSDDPSDLKLNNFEISVAKTIENSSEITLANSNATNFETIIVMENSTDEMNLNSNVPSLLNELISFDNDLDLNQETDKILNTEECVSVSREGKNNSTYRTCKECNKEFPTKSVFNAHIKYFHAPVDPFLPENEQIVDTEYDPSVCRYCSHKFTHPYRRIEHERIHTGEKPFQCKVCEKRFRTNQLFKMHKMTHTGVKPHKCHMCNIAFVNKTNLTIHIRQHLGDTRYKCSFCDKGFYTKFSKVNHERVHTGEKPFQCNECGKCFTFLSRLRDHCKRHSEMKPHKCADCGKCFVTSSELQDHRQMHSNLRPHVCKTCNATFPRKKSLKSHEKIHSDVTEYVCPICGKGFKQSPGLYCHMKSHGEKATKTRNK